MNFTFVKIDKVSENKGVEPFHLPSEEEIRAEVRQGEDAVVELVSALMMAPKSFT